jgi:hypothetical protein
VTDFDRGFISSAAVKPLSFVTWDADEMWLVYIAGIRTGSLWAGKETAYYRSVTGEGKMFATLHEAIGELERLANWIVVANAEFCRRDSVYA